MISGSPHDVDRSTWSISKAADIRKRPSLEPTVHPMAPEGDAKLRMLKQLHLDSLGEATWELI